MIGNQFQVNKSFKQWCIENNLNELLQLWDYEKNLESPSEVGFGSNKKFYFRCSKHKHPSEKHYLSQIIKSKKCHVNNVIQ